jgi:Kef-type K+ transport system membrane component KefB
VDIRKSQKRIITAVIGLAILAAIAAWQFYLFVVFKGADGVVDMQGGTVHLWVAIVLGLITCVAGFFLISSFRRYDRRNEMHITTQGHPSG